MPRRAPLLLASLLVPAGWWAAALPARADEKKQDEPKKDEKKDEPKKDEPKKDEPRKDEPRKDEPKKDEPKKDEPKKDGPKKDEPKKDEPKKDEPKKDEPKKDEPKKDKKGKGDGKRQPDKTSPVAEALQKLLSVEAKYFTDNTIELGYAFQPKHLGDWTLRGFDRQDAQGHLRLHTGSNSRGLLTHCLDLAGNFELELKLRILRASTRSSFAVLFGSGQAAAVYGNALAKVSGSGFVAVPPRREPDLSPFHRGRWVTLRYVIEDGVRITVWVDGQKRVSSEALRNKLDGRIGLVLSGEMSLVIEHLRLKGEVDKKKLKLPE